MSDIFNKWLYHSSVTNDINHLIIFDFNQFVWCIFFKYIYLYATFCRVVLLYNPILLLLLLLSIAMHYMLSNSFTMQCHIIIISSSSSSYSFLNSAFCLGDAHTWVKLVKRNDTMECFTDTAIREIRTQA